MVGERDNYECAVVFFYDDGERKLMKDKFSSAKFVGSTGHGGERRIIFSKQLKRIFKGIKKSCTLMIC